MWITRGPLQIQQQNHRRFYLHVLVKLRFVHTCFLLSALQTDRKVVAVRGESAGWFAPWLLDYSRPFAG